MAGHIIVEVMTEFFNTWLVVWTICYFSIYWETKIFQRGWNHQPDTFVFEAMLDSAAFHELGILFFQQPLIGIVPGIGGLAIVARVLTSID